MPKRTAWLLAALVALTAPTHAQPIQPDTLSALLAEVRQLRIAMERAAVTTPQIQLLGARLTVQNERVSRAMREHEEARRALEEISASLAQMTAQLQEMESQAGQETDPDRQRALAGEQINMKYQIADLTAREQRLRALETERAATLGMEQNQWLELNRRIDEIERTLGR